MTDKILKAILLQFSGIVGAGIFALPYVLYHSNFSLAVFGMLFIAGTMALNNKFYIDIICHTTGDHQLPGYAGKYLGRTFKYITLVTMLISGLGALLAYIQLGTRFVGILLSTNQSISLGLFLILICGGYFIKNKKLNNILAYLPFVAIIIALFLFQITFVNKLPPMETKEFSLLFFGASVFSLSGFTIIPEIEEMLRIESNRKKKILLSSTFGLILAYVIYIIFSYAVISLSGTNLSDDSVSGLAKSSPFLAYLVSFFGLLITFKSSTNFMGVIHEMFYRDLHLTEKMSRLGVLGMTLLTLSLFGLPFIDLLSWVGVGSIFMSVIIISLIKHKMERNFLTELLSILIVLVFIAGIASMVIGS